MSARIATLALAAALACAGPQASAAQRKASPELALAPDGRRGFGGESSQRDIDHLIRSKDAEDRAFFDELTQLSVDVQVAVLSARQHYSERGYFQAIAGSAGDDLELLHASYATFLAQPIAHLAPADARAKAFAAMAVDTRFNVRRDLLGRAQLALRELERARAVLDATVHGYASLLDSERQNVLARADLASAELRALRSDLQALEPKAREPDSQEELDLRREILEIARLKDAGAREEMLRASLAPRRSLEQRMESLLSTARAEPKLGPLRKWRARVLAAAAELRARALEMTPDTPQGREPTDAIARIGKSDRFQEAGRLAVEGLLSDPLDPELAWAAGHARAFLSPGFDELIYMDRFLALSGIRHHDADPARGRTLTERELEALSVVERYALK